MKACLKKFWQVIVLRGAYQTRYVAARQRTGSSMQIIQQNSESLWIELDDVKLKIFVSFIEELKLQSIVDFEIFQIHLQYF